jgi:glycogen synthase
VSAHRAPIRVALFPSQYAPHLGGVEELTARLARAIEAGGGVATVVAHRWPLSLPRAERIDGIQVSRLRFPMPSRSATGLLSFVLRFPLSLVTSVRLVRRCRADVVHVQCVSSNALYAWLAARFLRVPLVVSLQGELTMDADNVYEQSAVLRRLLRRLLSTADAVTACSAETLREAEQMMGVATGARGSVIFNGVDLREFEAHSTSRDGDHARSRRSILAIGRLVPEKGFDVLLQALATIDDPEVRLTIAGSGPQHDSLVELASTLDVADRVSFVGRTDRPATVALFQRSEVFVLSSRHEPFGIVNLEAMAGGAAIVATAVGGVPEIVGDRRNGLLIAPNDPTAMAAAIQELLDDDALRSRLVAAGIAEVTSFDWSAIADRYEDVYRLVIGDRARRPLMPWKRRRSAA